MLILCSRYTSSLKEMLGVYYPLPYTMHRNYVTLVDTLSNYLQSCLLYTN